MNLTITNKKNMVLGVVGLIVLIAVYVMGNNMVASLALWIFIIFLIFSALVLLLPQGKIRIAMEGPTRGEKSTLSTFRIRIRHSFLSVIKGGSLLIEVENLLTGETDKDEISVGRKFLGENEQEISIRETSCGSLQVSLREARWYGFFGILRRSVPMEESTTCLIMPTLAKIDERENLWDAYDMESHKYSQVSKGSDPGEVFSLREYVPGDSPKQIHWKLSGKLSQIIVKEPSLPVDNKLMILMDKDGGGLPKPDQRSEAAELCGSLSYTALQRGVGHSIGWYDQKNESFRVHIIREEGDLWAALEAMLQVGFWEEDESTVYRYLESELDKQYRNIIYVSEEGKDVEELHAYGQVHLYRPGRKA